MSGSQVGSSKGAKTEVPGRRLPARGPATAGMVTCRIARNPGIGEVHGEPAGVQKGVNSGVPKVPEMAEIHEFRGIHGFEVSKMGAHGHVRSRVTELRNVRIPYLHP